MPTHYRLICFFTIMVMVGGCTRHTQMDLDEKRERNLQQDLGLLKDTLDRRLTGPLSLTQAIRVGINNNIDLKMARLEELIGSEQTLAEGLKMLPELKARYDETRSSELRVVNSLNADTGIVQLNNSVSEPKVRRTKSLVATWNILDLGLAYVRSKKVQLETEAKKMQRSRQEQQIALDITSAYWRALLAERSLRDFQRIKVNLERQQVALDAAAAAKEVDLAVAKESSSHLLDVMIDIHTLRMEVSDAKAELARLMGVNPNASDFMLATKLPAKLADYLPNPKQFNLPRLEAHALKNRPELFEEDLKEDISVAAVHEAIINHFPALSYSYGRQYDHNPLLRFNYWNEVGTNISWNLLGLPSHYFGYKAAKLGVERAKAERLGVTLGVIVQTQIALIGYEMQRERIMLVAKKYRNSQDLLRLAEEKVKSGMSSPLDLSKRSVETLAASIEYQKAMVDLIVAHKRLLASIGLPPGFWGARANAYLKREGCLEEPPLMAGLKGLPKWKPQKSQLVSVNFDEL